ncbi:hypothetical protein QOT17_000118 [Balamuthia mandrillaris]
MWNTISEPSHLPQTHGTNGIACFARTTPLRVDVVRQYDSFDAVLDNPMPWFFEELLHPHHSQPDQ